MLDKNVVILEGTAGDDVKFGKSANGTDYCTFSLAVTPYNKHLGDDAEEISRSVNYIRVVCFNNRGNRLVDYLNKVGFHRGQRVSVFGWLSSRKTEVKGIDIIQLSVVVRDISVIDTKKKKTQ